MIVMVYYDCSGYIVIVVDIAYDIMRWIWNIHINLYYRYRRMARGPKKHMKRIAAPKSWMVSKLGGIWVTRSSQGPHKLRESIPLSIVLRNRLKLALNARDVTSIL